MRLTHEDKMKVWGLLGELRTDKPEGYGDDTMAYEQKCLRSKTIVYCLTYLGIRSIQEMVKFYELYPDYLDGKQDEFEKLLQKLRYGFLCD